jgi:ABC-2 type transport system ATP-binding protein
MPTAIFTRDLTKVYPLPARRGTRTAVDKLNLEVPEGQVFAFLGPNGAGKTTTIKMLLGFIRPTGGRAEIFGRDIGEYEARRDVGYLPEQPYFHKSLSPRETLALHAGLLGIGRKQRDEQIEAALHLTGLTDHHNVRISKLSKGLMQRVGIAQALIGSPRLLMLDEPTSGLDPIGRREMKDLILSLKGRTTVFLSSHLLSEVEAVADQVAILSKGNLVCVGHTNDIKKTGDTVCVCCQGMTELARIALARLGAQVSVEPSADEASGRDCAIIRVAADGVFSAIRILEEHELPLTSVAREQETLEDAFMRLAA